MKGPLTPEQQYELLSALKEGDEFTHAYLLGLDPKTPLTWRCEESVAVGATHRRVTLHVSYRGVMLRSVVATLDTERTDVNWKGAA